MIQAINLIVIRARDLETLRAFYEALGLRFVSEQHGEGPLHFAASLGMGGVVELYPARSRDEGAPGLTFGLAVDDVRALAEAAQGAGGRVQGLSDSGAQIRDPEGNLLIVSEWARDLVSGGQDAGTP